LFKKKNKLIKLYYS